nr:MAG TPA: hypothetical protein [Caudoviricetes sp.]
MVGFYSDRPGVAAPGRFCIRMKCSEICKDNSAMKC